MNKEQFEREEAENIAEIIESYATVENGYKRDPEEEEFEDDSISWVFTQKGEKLYRSLLLSASMKGFQSFGYTELDIEQYTGIKYD